jgi:hypothetical protein
VPCHFYSKNILNKIFIFKKEKYSKKFIIFRSFFLEFYF